MVLLTTVLLSATWRNRVLVPLVPILCYAEWVPITTTLEKW